MGKEGGFIIKAELHAGECHGLCGHLRRHLHLLLALNRQF